MFFNITPLIIDIPLCKPPHFPFGSSLPPPHIERTERRSRSSFSQSVSPLAHTEAAATLAFLCSSQVSQHVPSLKSSGIKNKTKTRKYLCRRALHPMWKRKRAQRRADKTEETWERSGCCWGVYITWDSTCNLVSAQGRLDTARWRTTSLGTVRPDSPD